MLNKSIKEYIPFKDHISITLGLIGLGIWAAYFIASSNENVNGYVTTPPVLTQKIKSNTSSEPSRPEMPVGYHSPHENRNPFALPPEYVLNLSKPTSVSSQTIRENVLISGSVAKKTDLPKDPVSKLRLTGIITSENKRIAVIQSASKSKQYQINDSIGRYKVIDINDETVILDGSIDQKVLIIEAAPRKSGDKNAK